MRTTRGTSIWYVLMAVWMLLTTSLTAYLVYNQRSHILQLATTETTAAFNKDLVYRRWATVHGGVYVPVTEETPPNPYLSHIPERDIVTPSGKQLTLMNPAYMTRQVQEMGAEQYGTKGHITSLNLLNPNNAPDPWERQALLAFEAGEKKVAYTADIDGTPYFRLMYPMVTEEGCLKCHGHQGYKVGDVRGGIGVAVPLAPYKALFADAAGHIGLVMSSLFLVGLVGLLFGKTQATKHMDKIARARDNALANSQRTRTLFERAPYGIVLADPDTGIIQDCNQAASQLVERTREELVGQPQTILHPPDEWQGPVSRSFREHLASPDGHTLETVVITKPGTIKVVEIKSSTIRVGGETLLQGFFHDITARKEAEAEVAKQQYYLQKAQELGRIGTWELNLLENRLVWTDENCRIFGVPEGSVVNYEVFLEKVHPEDREYVHREWMAALEKEPYDIVHRLWVDGQVKWVREKADVTFDSNGLAIQAVGFTQDITYRRAAEIALEESEARYRGLFTNMTEGFALHELITGPGGKALDYRFLDVNPAFEVETGLSRAEVVGNTQRNLLPNEYAFWLETYAKVVETGEPVRQTHYSESLGKHYEAYAYRTAPQQFAVLFRDVTQRELMEEQLRQTQKLESLGTLAGGIAHDFNNILGAVLGYSELTLSDPQLGSEPRENLQEVVLAARRAKELVNQILTFSRRESDLRKPVSMHLVVGEALRLLRQTIPTTIDIRQNISKEEDAVLADPTQLHQILMNLCTNAYHAMRETGGTLSVKLRSESIDAPEATKCPDLTPGDYVRLTVSDTGIGIPPEVLSRVFEPFFTTKPKGEGTGMGMAVVHGIVKSHGGAIGIQSRPGTGTQVSVYLPRYSGEEREQKRKVVSPPTGTESILFLDDEPALAKMAAKMLSGLGYRVEAATSSREALERFRQDPSAFDLVITDQTMPEMSGAVLAMEVMKLRPDMPVIICTGYSESMNEGRAAILGIRALLHKPLERTLLARVVREVLD